MVWIALVIIAIVAGIVVSAVLRNRLPLYAGSAFAIAATILASIVIVPSGEVGIIREFGEIIGQRSEGVSVKAPWQSSSNESIRVQNARFEGITAFSKETQEVIATIDINYRVSERDVQKLLREVGEDWFNVLIDGRVQNFLKEETVQYSTNDIAPNRENIRVSVLNRMNRSLEEFSVEVKELLIVNIDFTDEYKSAIEAKQVATQRAQQANEEVKITQAEAEKKRAAAKGEADAVLIAAEAEAEANERLNETLTPEVLQYLAITTFNDNVDVVLVPSGDGLLLDPSTFLQPGNSSAPAAEETP